MAHVLVGLGSNLGDSDHQIQQAIEQLAAVPGLRVLRTSTIVGTRAVGGPTDQPDFRNAALLADSTLPPTTLLDHLLQIEKDWGRIRTQPWGPRTIDLDLLCHGDLVLESEALTIPHRWMCVRSFVMKPCDEIAPEFVHPTLQRSLGTLWSSLRQKAGTVAVLPVDPRDRAIVRDAVIRVSRDTPWSASRVDSSELPTLVEWDRKGAVPPTGSATEYRAVIVFDRMCPATGWDQVWGQLPELAGCPRAPAVSLSLAEENDVESQLRSALAAITAIE